MAEYTIELRKIVESGINIFSFPYEFYDESKRSDFERDFIRHFYFREIGSETVDRFIFYLENKMTTVFPYYNEMFKANQIEYAILDNYKLTETITRTQENRGKASGVSSSVGQFIDDQQTNGSETLETTGNTSQNETGESETIQNTSTNTTTQQNTEENTTGSETVENNEAGNTTVANNSEQTAIKKFLDTPQGLITDLTDSEYLTTLNQDDSTNGETSETNTTSTGAQNKTSTGNSTSTTEDSSNGTSTVNTTGSTSRELNDSTTSYQENNNQVTFTGSQKSTTDGNTRSETAGSVSESIVTVRSGNIGVDTDSDVIHKHIKLQRVLKRVQLTFFDECEDLFMGVF